MIKLSLQSLCYRDTFNAGKITMLEIIDKAAEYRMDGVDLHFTHFASIDDYYLEEVKQACLKRGLHMCYIGVSNNFGKTGAELREQIDLMKNGSTSRPAWASPWSGPSARGCRMANRINRHGPALSNQRRKSPSTGNRRE